MASYPITELFGEKLRAPAQRVPGARLGARGIDDRGALAHGHRGQGSAGRVRSLVRHGQRHRRDCCRCPAGSSGPRSLRPSRPAAPPNSPPPRWRPPGLPPRRTPSLPRLVRPIRPSGRRGGPDYRRQGGNARRCHPGNVLGGGDIASKNSGDSWIHVKGNGYLVEAYHGTVTARPGTTECGGRRRAGPVLRRHRSACRVARVGAHNRFRRNVLEVNASGVGIWLHNTAVPHGNVIACVNVVRGAAAGPSACNPTTTRRWAAPPDGGGARPAGRSRSRRSGRRRWPRARAT